MKNSEKKIPEILPQKNEENSKEKISTKKGIGYEKEDKAKGWATEKFIQNKLLKNYSTLGHLKLIFLILELFLKNEKKIEILKKIILESCLLPYIETQL